MNNNKNYRIMKFFEAVDKSCNGKGYVKLDMRGNRGSITVNVENLNDGKVNGEVFLFKNKEEKIKIGPINTKRGRLQRSIVLNGKEESIENYNICGVVVNEKILMYTPVFMPAQVTQLNFLFSEDKPIEIIKEAEEIEELVEVEAVEQETFAEEITKHVADEKIIQYEDQLNDNMQENVEQSIQDIYQENEAEIQTNQNYEEASENVEQCDFSSEYEKKLFRLLKEFETIKPLAQDISSMKWWKVLYDENSVYKGFLPYFNQIITTYYPYPISHHITTCQTLLKKHGYYLFGVYEKNGKISKYVYGVPGKFTRDQQPYRGVTGFKNWSYKNNNIPGDYGYWLAFIDADTGAISDAPDVE